METNEIKALINSKLTLPEMQRQFVLSTNKTKIAIVWQGDRISPSTVNSSWLDYSLQDQSCQPPEMEISLPVI